VSKHTQLWYEIGPLAEEECGQPGGTPAQIGIDSEDGPVVIAEFGEESDRDRAVACHNACTGMADPQAEIAVLREQVQTLREFAHLANQLSLYAAVSRLKNTPQYLKGLLKECKSVRDAYLKLTTPEANP
jgi:hypothetical protein